MTPHEALATLKRLAELKAKSTPGIWRVGLIGISRARPIARCCNQDVLSDYDGNCGEDGEDFSDAPFIAAARNTDFAALAEAVEGMASEDWRDVVAHRCCDGKLKPYPPIICSTCVKVDDLSSRQLVDELAAANAEIARLRERVGELEGKPGTPWKYTSGNAESEGGDGE